MKYARAAFSPEIDRQRKSRPRLNHPKPLIFMQQKQPAMSKEIGPEFYFFATADRPGLVNRNIFQAAKISKIFQTQET